QLSREGPQSQASSRARGNPGQSVNETLSDPACAPVKDNGHANPQLRCDNSCWLWH
ncbi:hypothetical protein LEMLEM_LOCUS24886, partial [Lemmus lemmus]